MTNRSGRKNTFILLSVKETRSVAAASACHIERTQKLASLFQLNTWRVQRKYFQNWRNMYENLYP
jgi:hypothetical protein